MFLYKNNRVYLNNISFSIPDNVFLNCNCEEYDNCLELIPVDEDYRIIIFGEHKDGGAKQFFSEGEADACYSWIGELQEYRTDNISGYSLSYKSSCNSYTEFHFDIKDENDINVFGVLVQSKPFSKQENIKKSSAITMLLQSLYITK